MYNRTMERYEFNLLDQMSGGYSKSPAKVAAARANGRKCTKGMGGRPSARTLIERVLNRRVDADAWKQIRGKLFRYILVMEQEAVPAFFECEWNDIPSKSWRGLPQYVRQAIRHIKAAAKIYLPKTTRIKSPKDYIVVRVQKLQSEREGRERRHPNMPFVATWPQKIPMKRIFNYEWFDRQFARGVALDEADILRNGEGKIRREHAVALLKYLKFKYAK